MKRLFLIMSLIVSISCSNDLNANPIIIPPPQAFISELVFNTSNEWTLELEIFIDEYLVLNGIIDSIVLRSNSSSARLIGFPTEHYLLFVITAADLNSSFTMNSLQDTLRVITYANPSQYWGGGPMVNTHRLVYGYANCEIPAVLIGQSVCVREKEHGNPRYFYLDNSPTPGLENDTNGATLTLTGQLYDVCDNLISSTLDQYTFALAVNVDPCVWGYPPQSFYCPLDVFSFDQQGNYTTTLLSRNTSISSIRYLWRNNVPIGYYQSEPLPCENFSFFQEPGETVQQNIQLTDSTFIVGINEPRGYNKQEITVICAPNPVSQSGAFFITADGPVENAEIIICSAKGAVLLRLEVPAMNKSRIEFSREQLGAPGLCFFSLVQNKKLIRSGEIICL